MKSKTQEHKQSFGDGIGVIVRSVDQSPVESIVSNVISFECFGQTADCCRDNEIDFAVSVWKGNLDKAAAHAKRMLARNGQKNG